MAEQMIIQIPMLQLGRGQNNREHWSATARRVKDERGRVIWAWLRASMDGQKPPPPPWHVVLTRCSPADGLDFVNLCGSLKATQDQVAEQLKLKDDREAKGNEMNRATWSFKEQTRTKWGAIIEVTTRKSLPETPQDNSVALHKTGSVDD